MLCRTPTGMRPTGNEGRESIGWQPSLSKEVIMSMIADNVVTLFADGQVALWTEDERSIHLKAISPHGDPVELNSEEARELAQELLRLASALE